MFILATALMASTVLASVSGDGCPKNFDTAMNSLGNCCRLDLNRNSPGTNEIIMAIASNCRVMASNSSKLDSSSPTTRFDCVTECAYTKLGLMEKDKTLNKEKLQELFNDLLHEDFKKTSTKAIETCTGQKYSAKCPTGLDGMTMCLIAQTFQECPAQRWKDTEQCNESKKVTEKCWAKLYEDTDFLEGGF